MRPFPTKQDTGPARLWLPLSGRDPVLEPPEPPEAEAGPVVIVLDDDDDDDELDANSKGVIIIDMA